MRRATEEAVVDVLQQDQRAISKGTQNRMERASIEATIRVLKDRHRALELSADEAFAAGTQALDEQLQQGKATPGLTAHEFADKYLPAS